MSEAKSLPRSIPVTILAGTDRERVVLVEKLPLGRAAQLGLAFKGVGAKIAELREDERLKELFANGSFDAMTIDQAALEVLNLLPELLEVAADLVIDILVAGTGLERAELEQIGLDEATELLAAVITVNNLSAIQANLKNVAERLGLMVKAPAPTTTIQKSGSKN